MIDKHLQVLEVVCTAFGDMLITLGSCHPGGHQLVIIWADTYSGHRCLFPFQVPHLALLSESSQNAGNTHDITLNKDLIYEEKGATRSTQP